jgi:hypothetical protein
VCDRALRLCVFWGDALAGIAFCVRATSPRVRASLRGLIKLREPSIDATVFANIVLGGRCASEGEL